jgi:hypothetical protein
VPLTQADLFDRAAMCELASKNAVDEEQRLSLQKLRDLWIALANESPSMSEERLANEVAAIERIHAAALGDNPNAAE